MEDAIGGCFAGILLTLIVVFIVTFMIDFTVHRMDLEVEYTNYCNAGIPTIVGEGYSNEEGNYYIILECFGLGGK